MAEDYYDVIVVGAGNAGLCAALAAREANVRVLLLEKSPKSSRGGNTRFAGGGFRFTYNGVDDIRPMVPDLSDQEASRLEVGSYTASDFFEDVMQVTEYAADKTLSRALVDESYSTVRWLTAMKVKWILSTSTHADQNGRKNSLPHGARDFGQRRRPWFSRNAFWHRGEHGDRDRLRNQGDSVF